jgi:hypothetical protein
VHLSLIEKLSVPSSPNRSCRYPRSDSEKFDAHEVGLEAELFEKHLGGFPVLDFTGNSFTTINVDKERRTGFEVDNGGWVPEFWGNTPSISLPSSAPSWSRFAAQS